MRNIYKIIKKFNISGHSYLSAGRRMKFVVSDRRKGQLIVEAVVAISFIVIAVVSFFGLLAQSVGYNRFVSENYTATYLAVEGIEVVKNIIDSNAVKNVSSPGCCAWNDGAPIGDYEISYSSQSLTPYNDNYLKIDSDGIYNYTDGNNTPFKRKITIEYPRGLSEIRVISKVSWTSRGENKEVNLEDHFFDWRE